MFGAGISHLFSRLTVNNCLVSSRNISINTPLYLNVTNVLCAEPLKKKKKLDPAIVRAKEERRRKKLEKSIRRLEKHAKQLKPVAELNIPRQLLKELELRKRDVPTPTAEEIVERTLLLKEWTKFKTQEHRETIQLINSMIKDQEKALNELKKVSEELYSQAIAIDPDLLPYSAKGPTSTAPIENFDSPDGEYIDITRKYEGET